MFTFKIETFEKSIIELTQRESDYQIVNITGLNPPNAKLNFSNVAGMDGSLFNSSKLETRNIVITIKINGDIEKNRLDLYRYFRTNQYCKMFYKNGRRNVYIEGYVETLECDLFSNSETAQISVICPNPYFKDMEIIVDDISKVIKKFHFPFSINIDEPISFSEIDLNKVTNVVNSSESETGLIINATFFGNVKKFEIRNTITGEQLMLNYLFMENDILTIDCNKGNKSITLIREANEYNLIPYLIKGSIFFQLSIGDNHFSYLADDGSSDHLVSIKFKHYNVYRGV